MIPLATIRKAQAVYMHQRMRGVLVGTCALALQGWKLEPSDIDFYVQREFRVPKRYRAFIEHEQVARQAIVMLGGEVAPPEQSSGCEAYVDGVHVHYIDDEGRCTDVAGYQSWLDTCILRSHFVRGVRCASVADVLALKRWANRPKDVEFFQRLDAERELDALAMELAA